VTQVNESPACTVFDQPIAHTAERIPVNAVFLKVMGRILSRDAPESMHWQSFLQIPDIGVCAVEHAEVTVQGLHLIHRIFSHIASQLLFGYSGPEQKVLSKLTDFSC